MSTKTKRLTVVLGIVLGLTIAPAMAQHVHAQTALTFVPLGQCQMTSLGAATLITPANCQRASFTGTGSGTNLTAASVTGFIRTGDPVSGTGVPDATYIVSQITGVPGGAGVYITSATTTSSSASLTSGGIPKGATLALISAEGAAVRYRDDDIVPTAGVGMPLATGQAFTYQSTLSKLMIIQQASNAILNLAFYR